MELNDTSIELKDKLVKEIAGIISADWKNVYYGAEPYLLAMYSLNTLQDMYGSDSGKSIVVYFLANAQTWRGPIAKQVKKELNQRIKCRS